MNPRRAVSLAPWTTLGLGGAARYVVEAESDEAVLEALRWAGAEELPVFVFGGGSNVVVGDAGFEGLVIRSMQRGIRIEHCGDRVRLEVAAGEPWDEVVALAVEEGWAGLECLSGIPGSAGATPIQNVGAYGREVRETLVAVRVVDRESLGETLLTAEQCKLGYRTSRFRRRPGLFVILAVTFELRAGGGPAVRYPELARALTRSTAGPSLAEVRRTVLELRRSKSMVIDPEDANRRSVGSFFVNPVVPGDLAEQIAERVRREEPSVPPLPRFPQADGNIKLAAAWLIERCGFHKGLCRGAVGLSSRHALALVHHGGGTTAALLAFAAEIRSAVRQRFGVELDVEPTFVGCRLEG